jgi:peptidoglycan/xylan/chitin deacetylase (PgdA/CDA1 family)
MRTEFRATHRMRRRPALLAAAVTVLTVLAVTAVVMPGISSAATAAKPTVVTLTFDDSDADQLAAEQTMKTNHLVGTFYTVDGWVGQPGYLTRANLATIAADGNEIAGHTVTHPDLIQVTPAEAQRQICNDRATLAGWGYQPVDFAYPFSDANPTVEGYAQSCGYNTSRGLGDVVSPASCAGCVYAETTPPPDPQYLRAPDEVDSTWTLANLKAEVTNAVAHTGGWVMLTFHHVCTTPGTANCQADQSTTPAIFNAFVSWLATYAKTAANNTTVKTIDQQVRAYLGTNYPAYKTPVAIAPPPPAPVGTNALSNPSLETLDTNTGFPSCFQSGGWGTNTMAWSRVTGAAHTGTAAEQLTVTGYSSGDAKLLPTLDLGTCSPPVVPGKTYNLSTWYQSTGTTQFSLYYRDSTGAWYYWTSSPWYATAAAWTQATFTTPPVPANAVGMTFGLGLIANGALTTDDYSLVDPGTVPSGAAAPASFASAMTATPAVFTRSSAADPAAPANPRKKDVHTHAHTSSLIPGQAHGLASAQPGQKITVPEIDATGRKHQG